MDARAVFGLVIMIFGLITFLAIVGLIKFNSHRKQIEDLKLQVNRSKDCINNLYILLHRLKSICNSIVTDKDSYCDKCGQKIDWKDKSRSDIEAILAATNLSKANVIDSNLRGADK